MKRYLRRVFCCTNEFHREALVMLRWDQLSDCDRSIVHTLRWRCVDCGEMRYFGLSDNFEELRKARRIA